MIIIILVPLVNECYNGFVMITAIIQARLSSTRLPNKMLLPLNGKTVLENVVDRVKKAKNIDKVIVATSNQPEDIQIENLCKSKKIICFRGDLNDVLDRYYQTAKKYKIKHIARITGDCPLIDSGLIDKVADVYLSNNYDYISTGRIVSTFPDGLDTEIFNFNSLEKTWREAKLPSEREHVTPYIWKNTDKFKVFTVINNIDLGNYRLAIDEEKDYLLIKNIYENVKVLTTENILKYIDKNMNVKIINAEIERDEGYFKSLKEDNRMNKMEKLSSKNKKSIALWEKAKKIIPGGTQLLSKRSEMYLPDLWPSYFKKAKGIELEDLDGNKYIDMAYMGVGPCILGYADIDVNNAVKDAIDKGSAATLNSPEEIELADLLLKLHPWADMVRYTRSGGEAMAVAVRIARAHSKKDKIAFCGYHGWHDWYLSSNLANDKNLNGHLLPGLDPLGVPRNLRGTSIPFEYNKIEQLENIVKENDIGVIVMEPIRHQEPRDNFLKKVREIAKKINAVFIFDEISSGFRLTVGGAHLLYGVTPDIAVFSKAMSNGFPMAAIIGKKEVMDEAQNSFISSTAWTERTGPAAAIATIKKLKKNNVPKYISKIGKMIGKGWKELAIKHGLDVDIIGPNCLITLEFKYENSLAIKTLFTQEMLKRGYLATLTIYVCFSHKRGEVIKYFKVVDQVFKILKNAIVSNQVEKLLEGPIAHKGFRRLT